jgi:transposase
MIEYPLYGQIRQLYLEKKLSLRQIARELRINIKTVGKWARRESFRPAAAPKRSSKLDSFKGEIVRLLERHDYSTQQILQMLRERGYDGGYTIVKDFVRQVRPKRKPAFLTLHFEPGECAQVDWGCAGAVPVGSTRRRLSFFVRVLAFSRRMYLEFTLAETLEHFLSCHQRAFEYLNGVPRQVWVDNCKVAVLSRSPVSITFNPRYLDFAQHHGFQIRACGPGQPQEKGRVERGVGYVKKTSCMGWSSRIMRRSIPPRAPGWTPWPMFAFMARRRKLRRNFSSRRNSSPCTRCPMKRPSWNRCGWMASSAFASMATATPCPASMLPANSP